jgi:BirA family biotin operon repressor/biotin-[acetyl-CoA-carboxylase] ligase
MPRQTPLDTSRINACVARLERIHQVTVVAQTGSTNADLIAAAARGAEDGTVLLAEAQTAGRGRRGRQWILTPYEDLAMSVLFRPGISPEKYPIVTFYTGLAIYDALIEICGDELRLKWPNDMLLGTRKIAGILAESVPPSSGRPGAVVVGLGLNLNSTGALLDQEVREKATSVALHTKLAVDRTDVVERILCALDRRRAPMDSGVIDPDLWNHRAAWIDEEVSVHENGVKRRGVFLGIGEDGSLRLREASGHERRILCGDMMRSSAT